MNNELIPVALASSVVKLDHELEDWNLADAGEDESEPREYTHRVVFDVPFKTTPVVQVGLTGFDLDQRDSARLTVGPRAIDSTGFEIAVATWNDTRVYGVDVSWIAIGS
ncbi:UNVERIFIED_CONTAM: hypothetical protein GTU68_059679 [Idotea baltica]|nr:hypothetical protein [Idotea baltica]